MKKRYKYVLLVIGSGVVCLWYFAQYVRTGYFWRYVVPSSYTKVEEAPEKFFEELESYQSLNIVKDFFLKKGYAMEVMASNDIGEFKGRKFLENIFSVKDYKIDNKYFNLRLFFYNNRLAKISTCSFLSADEVISLAQKKFNVPLIHGLEFKRAHLVVGYEYNDGYCITFNEMRLIKEMDEFISLTQ